MTCPLTLVVVLAAGATGAAPANATSPRPVPLNPFSLPRDRIVPGTTFRIEISGEGAEAAKALFDPEKDGVSLSLRCELAAIEEAKGDARATLVKELAGMLEGLY